MATTSTLPQRSNHTASLEILRMRALMAAIHTAGHDPYQLPVDVKACLWRIATYCDSTTVARVCTLIEAES